jgi:hypothetical protein
MHSAENEKKNIYKKFYGKQYFTAINLPQTLTKKKSFNDKIQ